MGGCCCKSFFFCIQMRSVFYFHLGRVVFFSLFGVGCFGCLLVLEVDFSWFQTKESTSPKTNMSPKKGPFQ